MEKPDELRIYLPLSFSSQLLWTHFPLVSHGYKDCYVKPVCSTGTNGSVVKFALRKHEDLSLVLGTLYKKVEGVMYTCSSSARRQDQKGMWGLLDRQTDWFTWWETPSATWGMTPEVDFCPSYVHIPTYMQPSTYTCIHKHTHTHKNYKVSIISFLLLHWNMIMD